MTQENKKLIWVVINNFFSRITLCAVFVTNQTKTSKQTAKPLRRAIGSYQYFLFGYFFSTIFTNNQKHFTCFFVSIRKQSLLNFTYAIKQADRLITSLLLDTYQYFLSLVIFLATFTSNQKQSLGQ